MNTHKDDEVVVYCLLEDSDRIEATQPPVGERTRAILRVSMSEEAALCGADQAYWEDDWEAPGGQEDEVDGLEGRGDPYLERDTYSEKKGSGFAETLRPVKRSVPTARRVHLWKSTVNAAPVGELCETQELAALNEKWAELTDSEKQSTHRSRMKWVAERLHTQLGTAPTITAMMRHVGYPLGRRMTITQIADEVADAYSQVVSWEEALKVFESQHLNEKGKRQRVSRIKVKEAAALPAADATSTRRWMSGRRMLIEPRGEQEEARELEDLQTHWAATTVSDRAAVHYMRLKWVAARLSQRSGSMVTAAILQPVGRSMGLSLTLSDMETGLLVARQNHLDEWKSAVQEFVRAQASADHKWNWKKRTLDDQQHEPQEEQIVDWHAPKIEAWDPNSSWSLWSPAPTAFIVSDAELAYALVWGTVDATPTESANQQQPDM
jgi:hypothetical protein